MMHATIAGLSDCSPTGIPQIAARTDFTKSNRFSARIRQRDYDEITTTEGILCDRMIGNTASRDDWYFMSHIGIDRLSRYRRVFGSPPLESQDNA
jgi:hypothetical protein